jgi:acyl carrier protein
MELRVKQIVANVLNLAVDNIRVEASLKDDLGATSLDRYTVLMDLEEAFSLDLDDVPEETLETGIQTVADIIAFLRERVGDGAEAGS